MTTARCRALGAYEDPTQGERLARRQMEALDARRERVQGRGAWRSVAPGSTFTLADHAVHDGSDEARDRFAILAVHHTARNNLRANVKAGIDSLLGATRQAARGGDNAPASDASGTLVRVSEPIAGANWGGHLVPRLGQEVLVGFIGAAHNCFSWAHRARPLAPGVRRLAARKLSREMGYTARLSRGVEQPGSSLGS